MLLPTPRYRPSLTINPHRPCAPHECCGSFLPSRLQGLSYGDELARAPGAQFRNPLRRILEDAAAGFHAEASLRDLGRDIGRHVIAIAELAIEIAANRVIDVEPRHV